MNPKPVIPRARATRDIEEAVAFYLGEGAEKAAFAFVKALEESFRHLARFPATGSQRYAHALSLPDLRSWPVARYPYLVFYVEAQDHVDVWRVLHDQRDIPVWLSASRW